jgi:hypothetical protein
MDVGRGRGSTRPLGKSMLSVVETVVDDVKCRFDFRSFIVVVVILIV